MKIEKLSEDKIRITLNLEDLEKKHINFRDFMTNPAESQDLFLDVLKEAEEKVGFVTKDYKVMLEAFATPDGFFVLTVTRLVPEKDASKKRKVHIKRKTNPINTSLAIYRFQIFDTFCQFCNYLAHSNLKNLAGLAGRTVLYKYQDKYYLVLENLHANSKLFKPFVSAITEFASSVPEADLFSTKLKEYGEIFIKSNAIKICSKYFCSNSKK